MRYGIIGLVVNDYADYTGIIHRVAKRYRRSRVFISGSAAEYAPWSEQKGQLLVQEIARQLAANGFTVVSGSGLGVGPYVVNGVLEQLDRDKTRVVDDRLILRPFPLGITNASERKRRWTEYRQQILDEAGIAIFLFGNKRDAAGAVVPADGVEEEFAIAVQKEIAVVPIGCTGYLAQSLHERVSKRFVRYYPRPGYQRLFSALGKGGGVSAVAGRVVKLVKRLRDEA